jgi:hypothetical protein
MTRSDDRSGFAISEALTIKIVSCLEPILGPELRHDLRVQRTYGSSCGDDFVFMGGLNVAELELAQRPAGTHRRRVTLTGPRLQPKGPFGEPSNGTGAAWPFHQHESATAIRMMASAHWSGPAALLPSVTRRALPVDGMRLI